MKPVPLFLLASSLHILPATAQAHPGDVPMTPVLAIATVGPAAYATKPRPCISADGKPAGSTGAFAHCAIPAPQHFRMDIASTIYGTPLPMTIVASTSPLNQEKLNVTGWPVLVLFHTDGTAYSVPLGGMRGFAVDKAGKQYLFQNDSVISIVLPCLPDALREEIRMQDFPDVTETPLAVLSPQQRSERPAYLRFSDTGVLPRYAVSIDRLKFYLNAVKPGVDQMSCPGN